MDILRLNGYDVYAVYSGIAAVELARTTRPDFVISDVVMPDMSGVEAAIHIRDFLPECNLYHPS